ncbi:stage III sporulation protein AG [Bacillus solimangrovi]|uniref:Stage III sporulation protein AG n=2 Tax=Bacillus solimangrovi TaxID=1305675 RepID=A0A1E5LKK2_9BACI|nr:stage III sporulation protein AG [Bacillus solimangrovi]
MRIKSLIYRGDNDSSPKNMRGYLLIAILIGVSMMLLSQFFQDDVEEGPSTVFQTDGSKEQATGLIKGEQHDGDNLMARYEQEYEKQLKDSLEDISGVSNVTVMINLDSTETKVVEKNTNTQMQKTDETDQQGGKRKVEDNSTDEQVVIVRLGDREQPIIIQTKKPEVRGVLVVADGVENAQIKQWVVEAVTRVLHVPSHRVSVMPKDSKGE